MFSACAAEVMRRADALAFFSSMEGGICREYGTPALAAAMERVEEWMREAGMTTERDAFGSLIGTYAGSADGPPFVLGGHLDSVRDAGRYDGILGVLSGIAAVESLARDGRQLPFPVQVVAFADEEGLRFSSLVASRMWAGLPADGRLEDRDRNGVTLAEAVRAFGGDPDALPASPPEILGFLETHIEQGPLLEAEGLPVGVVSSIVGSERAELTLTGMAGHAGTVPMALRRDALAAAAEVVLAVERIVRERADGMVGTVGELDVHPGASNVIPGRTRLPIEVRHPSLEACREALAAIRNETERVCARRGVDLAWRDLPGYAATPMDADLTHLLGEAIAEAGVRVRELPSGAGHDAINIAEIAPVAMLFVRCEGGISHNPAEAVTEADVGTAIRVMRGFLERVAREPAGA